MTKIPTAEETAMALAEETAGKARSLLRSQGWCLLKCEALDGDTIALARNHPPLLTSERERIMHQLESIEKISAVYTETELKILCDNPNPGLLHEAKKVGAELASPP